jgi:superfamily II DNA/RNA helicase
LKSEGIPFSYVSGQLKKEEKDANVREFNSDKTSIMLITSSGGEGLSLKGTREVVLLEYHWNQAKIDQVIGRAIRYKSHVHLPITDRTVNVYHLLLLKPYGVNFFGDFIPSADEILRKLSDTKEKEIEKFYKILEENSIEKNKKCFN